MIFNKQKDYSSGKIKISHKQKIYSKIQIRMQSGIQDQLLTKQNCNKLRMISQSKQNFQGVLIKTDNSVQRMNKFMLQEQQSPILKFVSKQTRNFGVNTSQYMIFDNSVELILPITHLILSGVKNKCDNQNKIKFKEQEPEDGLAEQSCAPYRSSNKDPINNSRSRHKQSKNHYSYNKIYKSRQVKNWQVKGILNPEKVQINKPIHKESKLQQLINQNIKNMQKSQNMIIQSRKIHYKMIDSKKSFEDRPIAKRNFKISNMSSRLSQSKLAKKQQIINQAKKMVPIINEQKFSRVGKIIKNQTQKKKISTYQTQQIISSTNLQKNFDINSIQQNCSELHINLKTPISKIKRSLIEAQNTLHVQFTIPQALFFTPSFDTPADQLKQRMIMIFAQIGMQPQIISIKKYQDRVQLRNKSLFIIWGYDGSGYFGGWKGGQQILAESNRQGLGIQWSSNTIPIPYMYYGQFKDDKKQGYGLIKTSINEVYIGCWKNNQRWGWGKFYGPDGDLKYNGEFIQDKISTPELLN